MVAVLGARRSSVKLCRSGDYLFAESLEQTVCSAGNDSLYSVNVVILLFLITYLGISDHHCPLNSNSPLFKLFNGPSKSNATNYRREQT